MFVKITFLFLYYLMKIMFKRTAVKLDFFIVIIIHYYYCNNVFFVTFDQFNSYLLNKSIIINIILLTLFFKIK